MLNFVGYIPFVGKISAAARCLLGTAQIIGGLAITVFLGFSLAYYTCRGNQNMIDDLKEKITCSANYMGQGITNLFRACFEYVPFVSLVTCLPYDLLELRVLRYPTERMAF